MATKNDSYGKYIVEVMCSGIEDFEERQECCGSSESCPEYRPPEQKDTTFDNLIAYSLISVFLILFFFYIFKIVQSKKISQMSNFKKGFFSGFGVWIFAVISFVLLVEPYGSYYGDDELINILLWCLIPPIFVLVLYLWIKRFVFGQNTFTEPANHLDESLIKHQELESDTPHVETKTEKWFFQKLASGEYGLAKTFWLYGFTVSLFFGFLIREIDDIGILMILNTFLVPYSIVYLVGIWNATQIYSGRKIWVYLTYVHLLLGAVSLLANLVASYQLIYEHF